MADKKVGEEVDDEEMRKIDASLATLMQESGFVAHLQQASLDVLDAFAKEAGEQAMCGRDSNELRAGVGGAREEPPEQPEQADDGGDPIH